MGGEPDIHGHGLHAAEGGAVVLNDARVLGVRGQPVGRHRGRAEHEGAVLAAVVAGGEAPARAAGRVPRGQVGGEGDAAEGEGLAVADHPVDGDRREVELVAVLPAGIDPVLQRVAVVRTGDQCGAAVGLQPRQAAGMIEVSVAVDQVAHVPHVETQPADVRFHQLRVLREAHVEQYQALIGGEQEGCEAFAAGVVDAIEDLERLGGPAPVRRSSVRSCRRGGAAAQSHHC